MDKSGPASIKGEDGGALDVSWDGKLGKSIKNLEKNDPRCISLIFQPFFRTAGVIGGGESIRKRKKARRAQGDTLDLDTQIAQPRQKRVIQVGRIGSVALDMKKTGGASALGSKACFFLTPSINSD